MRTISINHVAFGAASLLHLLLLAFGGVPKAREVEQTQEIAIRFASYQEEPAAPPPSTAAQLPALPERPRATENIVPLQKVETSRPAVKSVPPAPAPAAASSPVPAPQPAATQPVPVAQVARMAPPAPVAPVAPQEQYGAARTSAPAPVAAQRASHPVQETEAAGGSRAGKGGNSAGKPAARLTEYLTVVKNMVENNREYPAMARQLGLQGTVTVRVTIRSDGSIGALTLVGSAGHNSLDKAARSAVKRSAPFKAPGGFGLGEVTVDIPIVYRLT